MTGTPKILSRTVILLGFISLFTDVASEMLYPVMPLYLESIGFSVAGIGLLEGIAAATAGLSKGFFGQWSDRLGRRVPFVQLGYGISALAKPLMAVFTVPAWVLLSRTADRLGKGVRTGARDALLAGEARPETKARVFGFHRAMDSTGAAIGPVLALLFLWLYPGQYRLLFLLAVVPGVFVLVSTFLLHEKAKPRQVAERPGLLQFFRYFLNSGRDYRRLLIGLTAFSLINSSDLFLLLLLKDLGMTDIALIGWYIFYNLVFALAAYPSGILADRLGPKPVFVVGLLIFAGVYGLLPLATAPWMFAVLFAFYGLYAAATDGNAKAWISRVVPQAEMGTATGTYGAFESLGALFASSVAGLVWLLYGPAVLFGGTAVLTLVVVGYFGTLRR